MWLQMSLFFAAISLISGQDSPYVEVVLNSAMTLGWRFEGDSIELTFKVRRR